MSWTKTDLKTKSGEMVSAQNPIIVSASRSTDIPAFYGDWIINRIKEGYLKWKNPFNGVPLYVSFDKARLFVFWSKNPKAFFKHLNFFNDKGLSFYFQYTLNDYTNENMEAKVGSVDHRIDTFIELSEKIGKEKVIWRFDPYILTETCGVDELLKRTEYIGDKLNGYTDKLVFSYADIKKYRKVHNSLRKHSIAYTEFNERTMHELASGLMKLNRKWNFEIATCAEKIELNKYNIQHNKCIDDDLIKKLFLNDAQLMKFLGYELKPGDLFDNAPRLEKISNKSRDDKGQREACGCIMSKDIGQYNTCIHQCLYCYANDSLAQAQNSFDVHRENPNCETITGE